MRARYGWPSWWVVCGVALGAGCTLPHEVLFPAPPQIRQPELHDEARLLRARTPSGNETVILHIPAPEGAPTLAWFHGNGQQLADLPPLFQALGAKKLGFFAVEYPGYGLALSGGTATEESVIEAADTALGHLHRELGVPPGDVVIVGQSIGSGVAVEMAARGHGGSLILLSPFTSLDAVGAEFAGILGRHLLPDHLDNLSRAPAVRVPTLLIHGTHDRFVPAWMSRSLEEKLPDAALVWVVGAGHNDLFSGQRGRDLLALLRDFALLDRATGPASPAGEKGYPGAREVK